MKLLNILLLELSPETRQRAIKAMKGKGQHKRASNWSKHYSLKDLQKFVGLPLNFDSKDSLIILSFDTETARNGEEGIAMHYGSPRNQELNKIYGRSIYYPESDKFTSGNRMDRKTARILSKIATTVNPDSSYRNGTGDFEIKEY